jgi:hypothetical protein
MLLEVRSVVKSGCQEVLLFCYGIDRYDRLTSLLQAAVRLAEEAADPPDRFPYRLLYGTGSLASQSLFLPEA